MIAAIGTALTSCIGWIGEVFDALTGTSGALVGLLPVLAIGIGFTILGVAIRYIRNLTFGA